MPGIIWLSISGILVGWLSWKLTTWRKNHEVGRTAGFPTFYSPAHITDLWWLALHTSLMPWIKMLPTTWIEPWSSMIQVWQIWKIGTAPFKAHGSDSIMLATPNGNMLWTIDGPVISQLLSQHGKTQTPTEMVSFMNVFGPSLGTVEGEDWKRHRRVVTQGFNPSTNAAVWREALRQVGLLAEKLESEGSVVRVMKEWTLRFSLHVIAGVLFHRPLDWAEYRFGEDRPEEGRRVSFQKALMTIIVRMGVLFTVPKVLLRMLPISALNEAGVAFDEWGRQIREMREEAMGRLDQIAEQKYKTILESVVLAGTSKGVKDSESVLPPESVSGNIFFLMFAGHETTGNTLGFILLLLAVYPEHQEAIQVELDRHFAGRPQDQWSVEKDFGPLQNGIVGAVQKEVLRLYQVSQFMPRITASPTTVTDSKGVSHTIPENTLCCLSFCVSMRHDSIWTGPKVSQERLQELSGSPALYFDPTRWLRDDAVAKKEVVPDWYIPFGTGEKACPGKAFALTELTAAMAGIFSKYSLELVVDEQTLATCNGDREEAWRKTRDKAIRMLYDDITSYINIELTKELPIRLVRRTG